jgi:hypothetical protein
LRTPKAKKQRTWIRISTNQINRHRDKITPRGVQIPRNAFDSSAVFTQAFVAAAIITLLVEVHQRVQALKKIGLNLEDIHKEIQTLALARIQDWSEKGY